MNRELLSLRAGQVGAPPPAGFAQLFPGWNVWEVWQSQDPIEGIGDAVLNAGVSLERQLRIWVEDWIKDKAPSAAVADPANPFALKGAQVEIIPNPAGLELLQTRADVPGLAGALQLGEQGSQGLKRTVRFYNRGAETAVAWPHDENYLLDAVYQPSSTNPLTNGSAPTSAGGIATDVAGGVGSALKVVAIVAGVGIGSCSFKFSSRQGRPPHESTAANLVREAETRSN
jgi:hypothetical protein